MLHEKHIEWIEARGISADLAEKLGLSTEVRDGKAWLSVPYIERGQVVNHKYRLISEKRHMMDEGAPLTLWNHDCLLEQSDKPVVICEGEWDAMTAISLGWRAVSVPNGAPAQASDNPAEAKRYDFLWRARLLLNEAKAFILATDDDPAGHALRQDLIAMLGAERCSFVTYGADCKDLNDTLQRYGIESVSEVLNKATPVPVQGLFSLLDFPPPSYREEIPLGVPGLCELVSIVPGTLTVLTGWAGQGKTSLTVAIVADLLRRNVPVCLGTFETLPRPILERKLRASMIGCNEHSIPVTQMAQTDEFISRNLRIIAQMVGEDHEFTLEEVLDLARIAVLRDGARVLILDPWNEIEHKRRPDESETEYAGRAIRAIKHFMRAYNVAVWIVAHPSKPTDGNVKHLPGLYSISGSAQWANKADYGLVYSRRDKTTNLCEVHVTKVRMGLPGREGKVELAYDWRISAFTEAQP